MLYSKQYFASKHNIIKKIQRVEEYLESKGQVHKIDQGINPNIIMSTMKV